jgi:hypothetical protein
MKKLILQLIFGVLLCGSAYAQYYYVPFINAGINPGSLNNDAEFPSGSGLAPGWVTILPALSTTWSANQSVPFTFQFNGSNVSAYKVSASGVLTFTTSAAAVPSGANVSLPSASIPNNSIVIWGLASTGTNDLVLTKTFGTAPNRQHWISFSSYSAVGLPTTAWTYWAIVLEETSNRIYIVDQRTNNPQNLSLTVGVQINASTAVQVFGSPNLNSLTFNASDASDNTFYTFIPGTNPVQNDLALLSSNLPAPFTAPVSSLGLNILVQNLGANTITSGYTLHYSVNNAPAQSVSIPGQAIQYQQSVIINTPATIPSNTPGYRAVKLWISGVAGDQNAANDTFNTGYTVAVDSMLVPRKPLIEHFTSSTCAPCASVAPAWNNFLNNNMANTASGNYTVVKMQQNYPSPGTDPAQIPEAIFRHGWYGVTGIPRAIVDGIVFNASPSMLINSPSVLTNRANVKSAFSFNLLSTYTGNTVNISGSILPSVGFSSDQIRAFVAVIENQYTFTGGTTSETNYFKVLRRLLPNRDGALLGNVLPNSPISVNLSHTFTVGNVTANSGNIFTSMNNLSIVAWIQHIGTKEVLQSHWQPVSIVQGMSDAQSSNFGLQVYPNPATDKVIIAFTSQQLEPVHISLTDMKGTTWKEMKVDQKAEDVTQVEFPIAELPKGLYILRLNGTMHTEARKLVIE